MRVNDLVSGLLLIVLAVVMIAYTTTFPPFPGQKYGPSLFPRLIGSGMIICGVLLVLRGRRQLAQGQPFASLDESYRGARGLASVAICLATIGFYIVASGLLGFVITGFLATAALLWYFRVGALRSVVIALIAVLFVDWFFGWLFRVPLPIGLLPNSPSGMLMNLIRGR
ncbi:MAG: tripartite tricarboxylate transporter TctB family protein [Beijerinckiaceae bacterium]